MITGFAGKYADFLVEYPTVFGLVVTGFVMVGQCIPFGDVHLDGRMEIDFQDIFSGFQFRLYVCFPFTEHVVGFQYFLFVQIYVCISVESFEYEVYILPLHYFRSQLEGGLVDPVFLIYPLHTAFVEAEEGIFDDLIVY